jgi:hypothetical protein
VRAACPEMPVDTDGWRLPGQRHLAAYARAAPDLGVPALYYAGRMDLGTDLIDETTWSVLADSWRAYRVARGLPEPRHTMVRHGA